MVAGPARSRRASKYFYRERLASKHHPVNSCQNHRSTHAPQSRCRIATHPRNSSFRRQCQLLLATAVAKPRSSLPWPPCRGQIHAQTSDSLSGSSSTRKTLGEFTCSIWGIYISELNRTQLTLLTRPYQREIIEAALDGYDVYVQAATSFGKSLCFQLPAVIDQGSELEQTRLIFQTAENEAN